MNRGFTLLEIIIVVLVVAVLAAIAVAQYQKLVERSKAMQAITLLKSAYQAAVLYQDIHGNWPRKLADLDVQIPSSWTGKEKWDVNAGGLTDSVSNGEWTIELGNENNVSKYVQIGRLKGLYRGTGFYIFYAWPSSPTNIRKLICTDRYSRWSSGVKVSDPKGLNGAYCNKIMHATIENGAYVMH